MNTKDKAARIRTLKADDTFKELLSAIKERQIAVFIDVESTEDQRGKAHNIICALNEIDNYLDSVLADEVIYDRKHKK